MATKGEKKARHSVESFGSPSVPVKTSLWPHLSTRGTQAVLVCADAVPTETADLIAAGAREEVDIIDLQRFHAQGALHGVVLHLRAVGHPIVQRGCRLKLSGARQRGNNTKTGLKTRTMKLKFFICYITCSFQMRA